MDLLEVDVPAPVELPDQRHASDRRLDANLVHWGMLLKFLPIADVWKSGQSFRYLPHGLNSISRETANILKASLGPAFSPT